MIIDFFIISSSYGSLFFYPDSLDRLPVGFRKNTLPPTRWPSEICSSADGPAFIQFALAAFRPADFLCPFSLNRPESSRSFFSTWKTTPLLLDGFLDGVIGKQDYDCANHGYAEAVKIKAGYAVCTQEAKEPPANDGTDDPEDDVEDETLTRLVDDFAADETGYQA
jgi:hypothetical protein